jgi:hypothetical protein
VGAAVLLASAIVAMLLPAGRAVRQAPADQRDGETDDAGPEASVAASPVGAGV